MVQNLQVIFARIPVLIEMPFAYGICDRLLLISLFKQLKCFTLEGKLYVSSFRSYFMVTCFQQQM